MYFDPQTNKFPYTELTDSHYLKLKKDNGMIVDKNYPYVDNSRWMRFKRFLTMILLVILVFPLCRIRMGLRVKGKSNLKKHKDELKKGVISCANHVHMWDYIAIMSAVFPFMTNVLVWEPNIRGENGAMMRLVGGIPIPENDPAATMEYIKQIKSLIEKGGWLHIYPEGSMWEYYAPIRPLKRGPGYVAKITDRPILPLAFSYRKPGFIRKKIFKQIACFTLTIGEPIYVNKELPSSQIESDIILRLRNEMCRLAGIDPEKNIYPPHFKNSKRIDYYTDKYGVGYKGSW